MKRIIAIVLILVFAVICVFYVRINYGSKTIWLKTGESIHSMNIRFLGKANKNLFIIEHNEMNNSIERNYIPVSKKFKVLNGNDAWDLQIVDYKTNPLKIKLSYQLEK